MNIDEATKKMGFTNKKGRTLFLVVFALLLMGVSSVFAVSNYSDNFDSNTSLNANWQSNLNNSVNFQVQQDNAKSYLNLSVQHKTGQVGNDSAAPKYRMQLLERKSVV